MRLKKAPFGKNIEPVPHWMYGNEVSCCGMNDHLSGDYLDHYNIRSEYGIDSLFRLDWNANIYGRTKPKRIVQISEQALVIKGLG